MALESATYISDLVSTNPTAGDSVAAGDDHLRLIKSTVKATFPNVTGAVNPTQVQFNYLASAAGTTGTASTNLVFSTSPTITTPTFSGLITNNGGQIKFPAAQSASADANTLDDYEEGTFTPAITFGGAAVGVVYTTQSGRYTKIGNAVTIQIYILISNKGSSTGAWVVTGLPFTSSASGTYNMFAMMVQANGLSGAGLAYNPAGTTTVTLAENATGIIAALTDTKALNNSLIAIGGTYYV